MNKSVTKGDSPSQLIDARIKELSDWRGEMLSRLRVQIKQPTPRSSRSGRERSGVVHDGLNLHGETYKSAVKLTFANGAALKDLRACSTQPRRQSRGPSTFTRVTRLSFGTE